MNDELTQELTQFKIVADMKRKQAKTVHEQNMILWRLGRLIERFQEYDQSNLNIEQVRKLEKKHLNKIIDLNRHVVTNWSNIAAYLA